MIYDNPYCMKQAKWLVDGSGHNKENLIKEISGELNRFFRLGQTSVINRVQEDVYKANLAVPK